MLTGACLVWASRKDDDGKLAWSEQPVKAETNV
jgi:hypothetical protein